ncbi:MAG: cob(I)yrinic acid a,c-diamide adenosyltransferase [Chitinophagaceae bacterium]|nr:cob(I)yrinic acid a,c-diamide adenosyltransferase [Chitinophagaceae bacterium]
MSLKIYTKTGDKGTTSLIGGTKVSKSHLRIEAYGTVDELNSCLGLCKDNLTDEKSCRVLEQIQSQLFSIGAILACDPDKETRMSVPDIHEPDIIFIEQEIDRMNDMLPPLKNFILPGGHSAVSFLHIARCVCRRAERCCVRLADENTNRHALILKYLNRLSDYLFVLARYTARLLNVEDVLWKPGRLE